MTYTEMKRAVYGITAAYFTGASVEMANTKSAKKGKPLVKLAFGPAQSTQFPVEQFIDGELCSFYPTTAKLEVQLFTNGFRLPNGAMENTAVGDLTDYVNYMMSEMVTNELNLQNLSMLVDGPVQDTTAIINDVSYEYRALVEFNVNFTVAAVGFAGVLDESSIKIDQPAPGPTPGPDPGEPGEPEKPDEPGKPTTPVDPDTPGQVLPPHIEPEWKPTESGGRNKEIAEKRTGYFTEVEVTETKRSELN
jgi:hypothetical protein